jgi:hypothetical protein
MCKSKILTIFAIILPLVLAGCSDDESSDGKGSAGASLGPTVPTGIITHRNFVILYDNPTPEIIDVDRFFTRKSVVLSIYADDIHDLLVNGQQINLATEWGTLTDSDSCLLENGFCTVTWEPGNSFFAPADYQVSFTAWTEGEESFSDENGNGKFDVREAFTDDLEEPFIDIDGNGVYDAPGCNNDGVCEAIDIVNFDRTSPGSGNGIHDAADSIYNGTLCADVNANPFCQSGATSAIIHTRSRLRIREPFDHDDDPDTDDILICS